jgi:hypothetical protein
LFIIKTKQTSTITESEMHAKTKLLNAETEKSMMEKLASLVQKMWENVPQFVVTEKQNLEKPAKIALKM